MKRTPAGLAPDLFHNDRAEMLDSISPIMVYADRVRELEDEGLTTSDAQGVADVEMARRGFA